MLNSIGILLTKYMEKTEVLKAIFASVSTSRICLKETRCLQQYESLGKGKLNNGNFKLDVWDLYIMYGYEECWLMSLSFVFERS